MKNSAHRRNAAWDAESQSFSLGNNGTATTQAYNYVNATRAAIVPSGRALRVVGQARVVLPIRSVRFLFYRTFGRRESLEALVRNRLAALDRAAVRTSGETGLGTHDGGELIA